MNLHNLLFERDPMKRMQMFENQMQQRVAKGIKNLIQKKILKDLFGCLQMMALRRG